MPIPPEQAETAALLRRLAGTDPVETHISAVFVGSDTVWKLKKAVRLPFLDFSPIEARRRFALRELELNRRAAAGLYRDVVPVVRRRDGSLSLGGDGLPVVDWVLRMARVPPEDFLDAVARAGRFTPALCDGLGDAVAEFHGDLPPILDASILDTMRWIAEGNARSARQAGLPVATLQAWFADESAALAAIAAWQRRRLQDGFVRRAHGDLHLGNLCLWHDRPVPFDALEFDERMATIDLGYDLAFLLMDLDRRVDRAAANRVLNRYIARTGDAGLTHGLPAFLSMRAMVRAHVESSRGRADEAQRYLCEAMRYLHPPPPILVAIGGLPGSGKSTLARALAPELGAAPGALVLRSDEIRKRQHGASPEERLPQSAYAEAASKAVFAALTGQARIALEGAHAAVADATFIDAGNRAQVEGVAAAAKVPFIGLWLRAPLDVLEARIARRRRDASDATVEVLRAASRADPGPGTWIAIDSDDAGAALARARDVIRSATASC
jgi:aminoglycoside phosphotransferase family enzyme/predicted kinase